MINIKFYELFQEYNKFLNQINIMPCNKLSRQFRLIKNNKKINFENNFKNVI